MSPKTLLFTEWLQLRVERGRECHAAAAHSPPALLYPLAAHSCLLHQAPQLVRTWKRKPKKFYFHDKKMKPDTLLFYAMNKPPLQPGKWLHLYKINSPYHYFKIEPWICLKIKVCRFLKLDFKRVFLQMGDLQTYWSFSYWGTLLSLSFRLKNKDRLSSMNNDSSDHSNHDVINLAGIMVGAVTNTPAELWRIIIRILLRC